jgi:hypothetical protein
VIICPPYFHLFFLHHFHLQIHQWSVDVLLLFLILRFIWSFNWRVVNVLFLLFSFNVVTLLCFRIRIWMVRLPPSLTQR